MIVEYWGGWQTVFYFFGIVGLIWILPWVLLIEASPEIHKSIHPSELNLIQSSLQTEATSTSQVVDLPTMKNILKQVFTSGACWALIVNHFCSSFGFFSLLSWLPTFFQDRFHPSPEALSFYLFFPYAIQSVCGLFFGFFADWLIKAKKVPVLKIRKFFQCFGLLIPASLLLLLFAIPDLSSQATLVIITLIKASYMLTLSGLYPNHLDIAPQVAGIVLGVGTTAGALAGVVGPVLLGYIVQNSSWRWAFFVVTIVNVFGATVWVLLAKASPIITLN